MEKDGRGTSKDTRAPVGARHEAHHAGLTDDRRFLWAGGLDDSIIYIFDVGTDPAKPKLVKTIEGFVEKSGGVAGPHGFYARPGRMLISALSNSRDWGGKTALVAFVYLGCTDASGCPLPLASLQQADRVIASRDDLRDRVRLVTVSFDPSRDTPVAMRGLRHHMAPRSEWRFLAAASQREIEPVLVAYGQDAAPLLTQAGRDTGLMRHVAKGFLIDPQGGVRNIYSSGFLDHRLLLRDIETALQGD